MALPLVSAVALLATVGALLAPSAATAESAGARTQALQAGRIDVGWQHSCAIAANGSVRCWGLGAFGQLGYGTSSDVGDN